MECPSCGEDNKEEAAFCMSCGESLPDTPFSQLKKEEKQPRAAAPSAAPPEGASKAAEQETTTAMPAVGGEASRAGPPAGEGAATPGPQVTSPGGFVFGGAAAASPGVGGAQPAPAPSTPSAAAPGGAEKPPQQAPPKPVEAQQATPAAAPSVMETPTAAPPPAPPQEPAAPSPPKPEYYIPPEADIVATAPGMGASPPAGPAAAEETPEAEAPPIPSLESTQAVAPVAAAAAVAGRESRVVCPECYAPNPPGNAYCHECGSALPLTSARQAAEARTAPGQPGQQQTAVLAPEIGAVGAAQPAYPDAVARARGEKSFGVADILAVIAVGASAVAVALSFSVESFWWKKGLDIGMFSHQGAYSQGRSDLLGGPGILPYEGVEFFTIGLVVALALALALVFLIVRVGRGPMYVLSGCILTFPIAYLFFQAILPLRQSGIDIGGAIGLRGMFFGDAANAGVGPPLWIITGAGVLLILAGFLAPPRGWGRLLTFGLCFSIILGIAFFCAACFNWNLFISDSAAAAPAAGSFPIRELYALLL